MLLVVAGSGLFQTHAKIGETYQRPIEVFVPYVVWTWCLSHRAFAVSYAH
jgi:hypothetical protein